MTTITQRFDHSIELAADGSAACATYRHGSTLPKPCLHPIVTPGGAVLSGFEMSDHVWHRGLWFTIKFINGTNFWEEQSPFGVQLSRSAPVCEMIEDGAVRVTHAIDWTSESTGAVIREN